MGGTRFIGVFLSRLLVKEGHQVLVFVLGTSYMNLIPLTVVKVVVRVYLMKLGAQ